MLIAGCVIFFATPWVFHKTVLIYFHSPLLSAYYKVFVSFDGDGDEALSVSELIQLMKYIGEYNDNFKGQDTLKSIDPNGESFSCNPVFKDWNHNFEVISSDEKH